jgi:uncharacterized FAD-dependent dehydrogenase
MERRAAVAGGGNLVAPVQRVTDFMAGVTSAETVTSADGETAAKLLPTSSYRLGVKEAPLHELYPPAVTAALRAALLQFDARMPGFISDAGLLHGECLLRA